MGEDGVCFLGLHDECPGVLCVFAFRRGKQGSADPDTFGASSQCRSDSTWRCDATCGEHGYMNRVKHGLQQRKRTHLPGDVPSSFCPLHNDKIDSSLLCLFCCSACIDLGSKHNTVLMYPLHIGSWGTE